jgi:tetratricopeptide (TPR) repeat protein
VEAERYGISALAVGRRLASRLEQGGDPDFAMAVLEILLEADPNQSALERDLSSLMRRQGMVNDLIDRYEDRAKRLLREGKTQEAIGWLREVLLLDGSRKDVARLIRNLRLKQTAGKRGHSQAWKRVLVILLVSLASTFLVLREKRLREDFHSMTPVVDGNLQSMRRRLATIEAFLDANPIWHGSLFVIAERSGLRIDIDQLEREENLKVEAAESQVLDRIESANLLHAKARSKVELGEFKPALEALNAALEIAPEDWEGRGKIETDIQAISQYLEGNQ